MIGLALWVIKARLIAALLSAAEPDRTQANSLPVHGITLLSLQRQGVHHDLHDNVGEASTGLLHGRCHITTMKGLGVSG
jgi:hypothetical protein